MIIVNCLQNTPEWDNVRCGKPTASQFDRVVTTTGARSKQREKYLYELAAERITGERKEGYKNAAMDRGHEREGESRQAYEFINGVKVDLVGFCFFDENKQFGCSPDGLIGEDGGFETKDTAPHIQIERLENGWSRADHFQQVQGGLLVTGRKWWDLVSYSRGIQPIIVRFERDEDFIKKLQIELILFSNDLNTIVKKYSA
jgi:hypothetical protein